MTLLLVRGTVLGMAGQACFTKLSSWSVVLLDFAAVSSKACTDVSLRASRSVV